MGLHTLSYTVDDGTGLTDTATVAITVTAGADAPVALDDVATVAEDASVVISVLTNDTDIDGDALTVTGATSADGTSSTDGATVTYSPAADAVGTHTVSYTVDDGTGLTDTATVTVTVTPVPDAPVAVDDVATVAEDDSVVISVLTNDTDIDGDALTVTGASSADGIASTDGTTVTYSPAADAVGTHTVSYTVDDGTGLTDTATVTVTVTPVNDAPAFTAGADVTVAEDAGPTTVAGWATAMSPGPADEAGQAVAFTATPADPDLFEVVPAIDAAGELTFTPDENAWGTTTVAVQLSDDGGTADSGVDTSPAQVFTITITPVGDAPVAGDDAFATPVLIPLVVPAPGVLANDGDEDGDTLTATITVSAGGGVVVLLPDGSFIYTPLPLFSGTDTFTYEVTDGTSTDTATVTIQVASDIDQQVLFLGSSGSGPDDWDFVTTPPAPAGSEPDTDGDGSPGLTVEKGKPTPTGGDGEEYQEWGIVATSPIGARRPRDAAAVEHLGGVPPGPRGGLLGVAPGLCRRRHRVRQHLQHRRRPRAALERRRGGLGVPRDRAGRRVAHRRHRPHAPAAGDVRPPRRVGRCPASTTPPPWSSPSPPEVGSARRRSGVEGVEEGVEGGVDRVGCLLVHPVAGALDDRLAAEVGAGGARVLVGVDAGEHPAHRVAGAGDEAGRLVDGRAGEVADGGGVERRGPGSG